MRHLKTVTRRARNNFREERVYLKASTAKRQVGTKSTEFKRSKVAKRRLIWDHI